MLTRQTRTAALAAAVTLLLGASGSSVARAQSSSDKAAARALFDDAMQRMESRDYPAACKSLEASERLDPSIGTLLYLAHCYESTGRVATAWATYREAASTATVAGQPERASIARRRAAALEGRLIQLVVSVAPSSDLAGLEVRRDGVTLPKAVWNTPLPIDPGEHTLEASAPGRKSWSRRITADESASSTSVEVPLLDVAPEPVASLAVDPASGAWEPSSKRSFWSTQTTIGLVVGAVGLVGIGVGAGFGVHARSLNQQASDSCRATDPTKCNAAGVSLDDQARHTAAASTVGFLAGGALLVSGIIILLPTAGGSRAKSAWTVEAGPTLVARAPGVLLERSW